MANAARYFTLNNGLRMPIVGLGTYNIVINPTVIRAAIDYALDIGYNHIDTARSYGTEADVGDVVAHKIKLGKVKRSDLFITTKVSSFHLSPEDAKDSVECSLHALKMNYVDMLMIHHPWGRRGPRPSENYSGFRTGMKGELVHNDLIQTWKVFETFHKAGKAKSLGVSNFSPRLIDKIWDCAIIKPTNVQFECHAYLQQRELHKFCAGKGLLATAYSPVGAPSNENTLKPSLLEHETVIEIARRHNKSPSQVLLRHHVHNNVVVIPKSLSKTHVSENLDIFDFRLSKNDILAIAKLDRNSRIFTFPWAQTHPEFVHGEPF